MCLFMDSVTALRKYRFYISVYRCSSRLFSVLHPLMQLIQIAFVVTSVMLLLRKSLCQNLQQKLECGEFVSESCDVPSTSGDSGEAKRPKTKSSYQVEDKIGLEGIDYNIEKRKGL